MDPTVSRGIRIAALYALFALIATAANLGTQWVVVRLFEGPWVIAASVLAGTIVGLPVKYVLDKKWIFAFVTVHPREDARLLALYTVTAVLTTLLFWGTEWLFDIWFDDEAMRLLGGGIGLAIGYTCKYFLDRRFVFSADKGEQD